MKLIVGLGNPGKEYENTPHNIGFMLLDSYLENPIWQPKFKALYTTSIIAGEKVLFLKPQTYMNLSGESVISAVKYFKIAPQDILIIQDDLDLDLGKYRIKTNSSAGGHNGIKSIINHLNTTAFARLKIGVSTPKNINPKDYVLKKFSSSDLSTLTNLYPTFKSIITDFASNDVSYLMNKYNGGQ